MSEAEWVTFSLRMKTVQQYQTLKSLAAQRKISMAVLGRSFLLDELHKVLADPEEISRLLDEEKQRLLTAAAELRTQST